MKVFETTIDFIVHTNKAKFISPDADKIVGNIFWKGLLDSKLNIESEYFTIDMDNEPVVETRARKTDFILSITVNVYTNGFFMNKDIHKYFPNKEDFIEKYRKEIKTKLEKTLQHKLELVLAKSQLNALPNSKVMIDENSTVYIPIRGSKTGQKTTILFTDGNVRKFLSNIYDKA